jgi:hypothetical protein
MNVIEAESGGNYPTKMAAPLDGWFVAHSTMSAMTLLASLYFTSLHARSNHKLLTTGSQVKTWLLIDFS